MIRILITLALVFISTFVCASNERTLIWNRSPLTLIIPVGQEVRVTFPTGVLIQVPAELAPRLESLAPNEQIVYWKAKETFDSHRVIATSVDSETVYLIDIVAQQDAPANSVIIEDPQRLIAGNESQVSVAANSQSDAEDLSDPAEIVLTRFAAQTLYAPTRLIPASPAIYEQPISDIAADFPLVRTQQGEQYSISIVGSWSGYGRYVTAVLLVNKSAVQVRVNPGLVNGNFTNITAQHLHLGAAGSLEDRTTLYLVSDVPFNSAILEDGYGY